MSSRKKKQAEALAALSVVDRSRLERLAAMAKLRAEDLWPDVWLYGFDDVEAGIQSDIEADEYFKSNSGIDNAEVMAQIKNLIAMHGTRSI